MMALAGVELETLVSEPDALTTRPPPNTFNISLFTLQLFTIQRAAMSAFSTEIVLSPVAKSNSRAAKKLH